MTKRSPARKPDAWMPWFIGNYLRDTASLTTEQHGALMLLKLAMWPQGGRIPLDDHELAAITRLSPARWKLQRTRLMRFFRIADEYLIDDEMVAEYAHATEVYRKRVESGKKGGRPPEPDLFEGTERFPERGAERTPGSPPQGQPQPQPPSSPNNDASGEISEAPVSDRALASLRKVCKELAKQGVDTSTSDPYLRAALAEGFTADDVIALARTRKGAGKSTPYLLSTLRGQRVDAQQATPATPIVIPVDPKSAELERELEELDREIYDARHACEMLKSITPDERDTRIRLARQRISAIHSAMDGAVATT